MSYEKRTFCTLRFVFFLIKNLQSVIYGVYLSTDVSWCEIVTKFYIGSRFFRIAKIMVTIKEEFIQGQCYRLGYCSKNSIAPISDEPCGPSGIYLPAGLTHVITKAISEK